MFLLIKYFAVQRKYIYIQYILFNQTNKQTNRQTGKLSSMKFFYLVNSGSQILSSICQ